MKKVITLLMLVIGLSANAQTFDFSCDDPLQDIMDQYTAIASSTADVVSGTIGNVGITIDNTERRITLNADSQRCDAISITLRGNPEAFAVDCLGQVPTFATIAAAEAYYETLTCYPFGRADFLSNTQSEIDILLQQIGGYQTNCVENRHVFDYNGQEVVIYSEWEINQFNIIDDVFIGVSIETGATPMYVHGRRASLDPILFTPNVEYRVIYMPDPALESGENGEFNRQYSLQPITN